jgi:hypothetical protein
MIAATLNAIAAAVVMPKKEIHISHLHMGSEAENAGRDGEVPVVNTIRYNQ